MVRNMNPTAVHLTAKLSNCMAIYIFNAWRARARPLDRLRCSPLGPWPSPCRTPPCTPSSRWTRKSGTRKTSRRLSCLSNSATKWSPTLPSALSSPGSLRPSSAYWTSKGRPFTQRFEHVIQFRLWFPKFFFCFSFFIFVWFRFCIFLFYLLYPALCWTRYFDSVTAASANIPIAFFLFYRRPRSYLQIIGYAHYPTWLIDWFVVAFVAWNLN